MKIFSDDRALRVSYYIGGGYNICTGFLLFFFSESLLNIANIPTPEPLLYMQITNLFLIVVGYWLLYAAQEPRKLAIIEIGSCITRLTYFLFSLSLGGIYIWFGLIDFLICLIILFPLVLTEGISWRQLWEYPS